MLDLVAFNDRLYMHTGSDVFESTDGGASWENVPVNADGITLKSVKKGQSQGDFSLDSRLVATNNALYGIIPEEDDLRVFHLPVSGDAFVPAHKIPTFAERSSSLNVWTKEALAYELWTSVEEVEQDHFADDFEAGDSLPVTLYFRKKHWEAGGFAVSDETFYIECQRRLFKWKPGSQEWRNTRLIDTSEQPNRELNSGFKLAVSAETVYVGKRDGKLFQSLDGGDSWKDVTSSLPLRFTRFKRDSLCRGNGLRCN